GHGVGAGQVPREGGDGGVRQRARADAGAAPVPGARAREGEGGAAVVRARPQPHAKPRSATRLTRHPISEAASFARRRVGRGGEQAADRRPGIASSPPAGVRIPPSPAIRTVASQSLTPTYSVASAAGPENFSAPRAERD